MRPVKLWSLLAAVAALIFVVWRLVNGGTPADTSQGPVVDPARLVRPHSPTEGPAGADVVITEFFDPACGTCREFYPQVQRLIDRHPGRIRLVLRYAPFHQGSDKVVAQLAAAHLQGRFRPALEALFAGQDDWASNHVAKSELSWKYLQRSGLDMERLAFDLTAPQIQQALAQDLQDANALGVEQTPEYFVNGRPLPSFGLLQLQTLVAEELARRR